MHIHLVDPAPIALLTSGSVDIIRLLNEEDVSFWVEVIKDNGDFQRYIESRPEDATFAQIARDYDVLLEGWWYTIIPPLTGLAELCSVRLLQDADTLRSKGVFFGSTVRFSKSKHLLLSSI
jgi:hypothetical protein